MEMYYLCIDDIFQGTLQAKTSGAIDVKCRQKKKSSARSKRIMPTEKNSGTRTKSIMSMDKKTPAGTGA